MAQMTGDEARRRQRASKDFERRVARALGFDRHINDGHMHSDGNDDAWCSLEVTQTVNPKRAFSAKRKQVARNSAAEGLPPVLVVGKPGAKLRDAQVKLSLGLLLDIAHGRYPIP